MSKGLEMFDEWTMELWNDGIMAQLCEDVRAIDEQFLNNVDFEYRNGVIDAITYAHTLAGFIEEHEEFMEMINGKD